MKKLSSILLITIPTILTFLLLTQSITTNKKSSHPDYHEINPEAGYSKDFKDNQEEEYEDEDEDEDENNFDESEDSLIQDLNSTNIQQNLEKNKLLFYSFCGK